MHFTVFFVILFTFWYRNNFQQNLSLSKHVFFQTTLSRSSRLQTLFKIGVLKDSQIHRKTTALESVFNNVAGLKARNFIKKVTPTQVLSCEYCRIFKSGYFYRTPPVAAYKYPLHCMKSVRIRKNRDQKKFPMR